MFPRIDFRQGLRKKGYFSSLNVERKKLKRKNGGIAKKCPQSQALLTHFFKL